MFFGSQFERRAFDRGGANARCPSELASVAVLATIKFVEQGRLPVPYGQAVLNATGRCRVTCMQFGLLLDQNFFSDADTMVKTRCPARAPRNQRSEKDQPSP